MLELESPNERGMTLLVRALKTWAVRPVHVCGVCESQCPVKLEPRGWANAQRTPLARSARIQSRHSHRLISCSGPLQALAALLIVCLVYYLTHQCRILPDFLSSFLARSYHERSMMDKQKKKVTSAKGKKIKKNTRTPAVDNYPSEM